MSDVHIHRRVTKLLAICAAEATLDTDGGGDVDRAERFLKDWLQLLDGDEP
jgi:hypothetical protein